jgi:hypothetical protein
MQITLDGSAIVEIRLLAAPAIADRPALSPAQRLAKYLLHEVKQGRDSGDTKAELLSLQVDASHPAAAAVQVRIPFEREVSTVNVDTSRLPCDHGRRA